MSSTSEPQRGRDLRMYAFGILFVAAGFLVFAFIDASVAVAVMCTAVGASISLFIARAVLPPWRGSPRDQVLFLVAAALLSAVVVGILVVYAY